MSVELLDRRSRRIGRGIARRGRISRHDAHHRTLRNFRRADDGTVRIDRQRHAQFMSAPRVDAENVVKKKWERFFLIKSLTGLLRVLLEHLQNRCRIEAHQDCAVRFGHAHGWRGR